MRTEVEPPCPLDAVIDHGFGARPSRAPDYRQENEVLLWLADEMSRAPGAIFERVVEAVLVLCPAQSSGISLLDKAGQAFVWPAVAGQWAAHAGGSSPRDFGPCGTVMDRDAALLFERPERHFTYLCDAMPRIEEGLLVPFRFDGMVVGTIWAISHDPAIGFEPEDARLLDGLGKFTAVSYRALARTGVLAPPSSIFRRFHA